MGYRCFHRAAGTVIATTIAIAAAAGQAALPPALEKMAETERAFAKRAQDTTVREAFIEFFADESVAFEPDPVPARESWRKRTTKPPPGAQLLWEPRLGDVAASGDLGYLTGPATNLVPNAPPRYMNYFSIWKRQPNGEYRVIIDQGIGTPAKVDFAPGVVRATPIATWKGKESKAAAESSLLAADKAFGTTTATKGAVEAYTRGMHPDARVMRPGFQPMARTGAIDWMKTHAKAWSTEPMKAETSEAGDLGYTWGKFSLTPPDRGAYGGYYVRVWTRKADGSWQIVAEVTTPPPPPPKA